MIVALVAPTATVARADAIPVYTVYGCEAPGGAGAGLDGWAFSLAATHPILDNRCRSGGPLRAGLDRRFAHGRNDTVEAIFTAPADTTIAAYSLWRSAQVTLSSQFQYAFAVFEGVRDTPHVIQECNGAKGCSSVGSATSPFAGANRLSRNGLNGVHRLWVDAVCRAAVQPSCAATSGTAAEFQLHRTDIALADTIGPVLLAEPSGSLVDSGAPLTGVKSVSVAATDRGGGVYQAHVEVDGRIVQTYPVDDNDGRCRLPFTTIVPCKSSASRTLDFDTAQVPDGSHLLRILVSDATGSNMAIFGPTVISTSNGPCLTATRGGGYRLRASFGNGRATTTVRYGRGATVKGRLTTDTGTPVSAATLCAAGRLATSRLAQPHATVKTDARGRFRYRVHPGASRRLRFVFRTPDASSVWADTRLRVRAGITEKPSRRSLHNGDRLLLHGHVIGRPIPGSGVAVALQVRKPKGWQTFGFARTDRAGRYRFAYRFTNTTGVQRYSFRAMVFQQSGYPYAAGASKPTPVIVRGG